MSLAKYGGLATDVQTFNVDCGSGSDRLFEVWVTLYHDAACTIDGVTLDGVSLTKKDGIGYNYAGARWIRVECWYTTSPPTGTKEVVVTTSTTPTLFGAIATVYTGCSGYGANVGSTSGNLSTVSMTFTTGASTSWISACWMGQFSTTVTPGTGVTLNDAVSYGETPEQFTPWAGFKDATGGSDTWEITLGVTLRSAAFAVEVQEAAGTGDLTVNVSDTVQAQDTPTVTLPDAMTVSVTDTAQAQDDPVAQIAALEDYTVDVSDTVQAQDTADALLPDALLVDVTDTSQAQDTATVVLPDALQIGAGDTVQAQDAATVVLPDALAVDVTDTSQAQDAATVVLPDALLIDTNDGITAEDTPDVAIGVAGEEDINVQDTAAVADVPLVTVSDPLADVSDTIAIGEDVNVTISALDDYTIDVSDGVTVADAAQAFVHDLTIDISDGMTIADAASASVTVPGEEAISAIDTAAVGEQIVIVVSDPQLNVTDTVAAADSASVQIAAVDDVTVNVTDTIAMGEFVALEVSTSQINVTDTITLGDTVALYWFEVFPVAPLSRRVTVPARDRTKAAGLLGRTKIVDRWNNG
jgi:hypothetical protein